MLSEHFVFVEQLAVFLSVSDRIAAVAERTEISVDFFVEGPWVGASRMAFGHCDQPVIERLNALGCRLGIPWRRCVRIDDARRLFLDDFLQNKPGLGADDTILGKRRMSVL